MGSLSKMALAKFAAAARGAEPAASSSKENKTPVIAPTNAPGVALSRIFQFQSYFSTTLLEKALLTQSRNEPIVGSTLREEQVGGYGLALHPSSQCPVAVQPLVGGQAASPQAVILAPGQIFRPHGKPGEDPGHFGGFRWGLPFGWLGGGAAQLIVLRSPDAEVYWEGGTSELIYHRTTMKILAPSGLAAQANAPKNWPLRFPWSQAVSGTVSQAGAASIGIVRPTRVEMSLQAGSLVAASSMRVLIQGSNDFDLDSAGAPILTRTRFVDLVWGSYVVNGGTGNLGTNWPIMELTGGPLSRIAADDGGVQLVDMTAGGALTGLFVDVVRYGGL